MHPPPSKHVLILAGGGLTPVSGGVGTLLTYLIAAWKDDAGALPVRVIDTRGAAGPASAALHFARALAALLAGCLAGTLACAHIHMTTRGSALRKAMLCHVAHALSVPVVLHLHGADFFAFHAALPNRARRALNAAILKAGAVIVIGAEWRGWLMREASVPPDRIRIVANGVPASRSAQPPPGAPHILFLGRIGERKGVGDLIAALASPAMAQRAWTATIAGDGDPAPYRARIEAAGMAGRIAMPGWQTTRDADRLLSGAAMLVLPSHHEVMPMAILEAMARGIAIVATPVGAIGDILTDGVSARLVPPGAPAHLATTLAELLDDPAERARLGQAAQAFWAERLDVAVTAAEIQAIYRDILPAAPPYARPRHAVA